MIAHGKRADVVPASLVTSFGLPTLQPLRNTTLRSFTGAAGYEELSMFSLLCARGQDCSPAGHRARGEG